MNTKLSLEFLAMFTGWLADRFPHRNIVVAGALIATVGFVISSFATNIYLIIFGYGILAGSCYKICERLLSSCFLDLKWYVYSIVRFFQDLPRRASILL